MAAKPATTWVSASRATAIEVRGLRFAHAALFFGAALLFFVTPLPARADDVRAAQEPAPGVARETENAARAEEESEAAATSTSAEGAEAAETSDPPGLFIPSQEVAPGAVVAFPADI